MHPFYLVAKAIFYGFVTTLTVNLIITTNQNGSQPEKFGFVTTLICAFEKCSFLFCRPVASGPPVRGSCRAFAYREVLIENCHKQRTYIALTLDSEGVKLF